jgi:hypothetical protein
MHLTKPIDSHYFPVRRERARSISADFGFDVTICIAAATKSGMADGHIVTVSDRMISATDDSVQATEALKARKISKTWALMFEGDGNLFLPIVAEIKKKFGDFDKVHDFATVQSTVCEVYRTMLDIQCSSEYLSRYGLASISEFRKFGLSNFGEKFYDICKWIDGYDLRINILIYGFDQNGLPHIFDISNPGVVTNHDLLGYAAIGSGETMAMASLRRKQLPYDLNKVVYRLLEAKFSAETASGVGESTTLFTMRSDGKDKSIGYGSIGEIKKIWKRELEREPDDALDIISKLV